MIWGAYGQMAPALLAPARRVLSPNSVLFKYYYFSKFNIKGFNFYLLKNHLQIGHDVQTEDHMKLQQ